MQAVLRALMPQFALRAIPARELQHLSAPTTLIWGRADLQVRLGVAEAASERYGWPLHVIENAADDPAFEQPAAFLGRWMSRSAGALILQGTRGGHATKLNALSGEAES